MVQQSLFFFRINFVLERIEENMRKLRDLDGLRNGINKRWVWKDRESYSRVLDYLQKICFTINDLNNEINNLANSSMKEVIYTIVLVDWICEAVDSLKKMLNTEIMEGFIYTDDDFNRKALKYFKALRSFVVAHPLNTDRHKEYGFDGDKICVDVRNVENAISFQLGVVKDMYYLNFDGFTKKLPEKIDCILYTYSKEKDNMKFFDYIAINFCDIYKVAELQIDMLYCIDKYLNNLRKKDFIVNV